MLVWCFFIFLFLLLTILIDRFILCVNIIAVLISLVVAGGGVVVAVLVKKLALNVANLLNQQLMKANYTMNV